MPKWKQIHYLEMVQMTMGKCSTSALKARGIQGEMFSYNKGGE